MTELAREYGEGLFELAAEENLLDVVHEQLDTLSSLLREDPRFLRVLESRALPKTERLTILDETFRDRVHAYLLNFMKLLLERGALNAFFDCERHFHSRYCEEKGIAEARITVASPLTDAQKSALVEKLGKISGKRVELIVLVDPTVVGGLRVDMEGIRYDNTIQHRLSLMRRKLTDEM